MIVIHIGLRKSGSTSIQNFLSANEQALRRMGVDYPTVGRLKRVDHNNLAAEIRGRRNFDSRYGTLSQLAEHWHKSSSKVLLLSGEAFEECNASHVARLRSISRQSEEPFLIVLYLRDLISLMPSSYAQKVKNGRNTYDFDTFFEERMVERRVNYFDTAERWAEVFGWESIQVRVLDTQHLVNGDLIDDFISVAGLGVADDEARLLQRPGSVNESPGWRVLEAVRALYDGRHELAAGHPLADATRHDKLQRMRLGPIAARVGEQWGWNKDRGLYLTRVQAQDCLDLYNAAIEALNDRQTQKLPAPPDLDARGFVERKFLPDATLIPRELLQNFYDRVGALWIEANASVKSLAS